MTQTCGPTSLGPQFGSYVPNKSFFSEGFLYENMVDKNYVEKSNSRGSRQTITHLWDLCISHLENDNSCLPGLLVQETRIVEIEVRILVTATIWTEAPTDFIQKEHNIKHSYLLFSKGKGQGKKAPKGKNQASKLDPINHFFNLFTFTAGDHFPTKTEHSPTTRDHVIIFPKSNHSLTKMVTYFLLIGYQKETMSPLFSVFLHMEPLRPPFKDLY